MSKHYYAYLVDSSGNRGSWIANDYPNKKDVFNEISKLLNICKEVRVEIIESDRELFK